MSTVYSVRISKELKDALERLNRVDWQGEVRAFLQKKVSSELRIRQLNDARKFRATMKRVNAAEIIRKDRENSR
jgi:hypothetical protein